MFGGGFTHAFKMPERTFIVSDLAARPAPEFFYLYYFIWYILFSVIGRHTKRWNRITPDRNNWFFISSGNMHEASIMRHYNFRFLYKVCAFINVELTASII